MSPLDSRDTSRGLAPVLSRRRLLQGIGAASGFAAIGSLLAACSGSGASAPAPTSGGAPAAASTAASSAAGATSQPAAQQVAPGGFANVGTIKILMSSHFVPAYDTWFDQWAKDWGDKNHVETKIDYITSVGKERIRAHETALVKYAHERLREINSIRIIGNARDKGPIVSFELKGAHPHDVATIIDRAGVAVRAGTHCTMPLLARFGVTATCRASFGLYNTMDEVDALAASLIKAQDFLS